MLFTTDKQTLEDLNIFGRHGGDSVYNIFNRCATRGGAAILEEMFRYPLSDDAAINRRCGIVRHFAEAGAGFPFQSTLFDAAEPYLANTDQRTRLTAQEHSVAKKLSNIIALDVETQQVYNGVNALVELLKGMTTFIAGLHIPEDHPYATDKAGISAILSKPAFAVIIESKGKLQHSVLADFDVLLRFRHREDIQKLLRYIYFLDVYLSIAMVAKERGFSFPQALPPGQHVVRLEGVYHPQVKNAVPNNISVTPENNVIFLTGANMAGKSTFMKSFSIAMFLAHMGFPVAAKTMEFSVLDGIYTTINLPDNLGMGASHFYAEVLRVKRMANELSQGKNLLIVFDELFRGTNVKDAYEATIAITKGFAGKRNSLFVISTHIIEAGDVLRKACHNVRFVCLPTQMNGHHPVYTYTLKDGITDDRHGMIIINNEGILGILEAGIKKMKTT
jgi:DNA mismatch repair protein MutS